jgi:hypothetical protein
VKISDKKILIISLGSLSVLLILIVLRYTSESGFGKRQAGFAAVPDEDITRIEFVSGNEMLELKQAGDSWLINGKSEARENGISFIKQIVTELEIKSPVSNELFDSVKGVSKEPVKVKVYENRRLLTSFIVYKSSLNQYGNVMKKRENSKPFIVHLPGYNGNIGTAFITEEEYWQPYIIFSSLPSEIESVSLENISDTTASFSVVRQGESFILLSNNEKTNVDSLKLRRYISYFTRVPFERWLFDLTDVDIDSITTASPLYRIKLNNTSGKITMVTLWERGLPGQPDTDRLWGRKEGDSRLFVARYLDIDPLLKRRSYFDAN